MKRNMRKDFLETSELEFEGEIVFQEGRIISLKRWRQKKISEALK